MNILFFLFEIILFGSVVVWFNLIPGYLLLQKFEKKMPVSETVTVSLILGIILFTILLYVFSWLKIGQLAYLMISAVNVYLLLKNKTVCIGWPKSFFTKLNNSKAPILIITLLTFFSGSLLFKSGLADHISLYFIEARDSFWHLGLMLELVRSVPPIHPGFAGLPLTNYHIFTHLFGSGFLKIGLFNSLDFYYRLFPFYTVFIYVLSLYVLGKNLTGSRNGGLLSSVFGMITGSFAYVLPLFIKYPGFVWHESSFWLSQPFSMVINPSFALSSSLVLASVFLTHKIGLGNKKLWPLLSLIAGIVIVFKVYAGILVLFGLSLCAFWQYVIKKDSTLLKSFIAGAGISVLLFLPQNKDAGNFLVFMPGWFLKSMVESPDRVQIMDWVLREITYAEKGNSFAIMRYRFLELIIYLVGNLGIRVLGFWTIISALRNIRKINPAVLSMLIIFITGMTIPLLFVQDGSIANTLQFSYYSLEIMSLFMVIALVKFLNKTGIYTGFAVCVILFFIAIPTSLETWYHYVLDKYSLALSASAVESYDYLKKNTNDYAVVMVPATGTYTTSLIAGTLSNRRLFYGDRLMAENTHKDFNSRELALKKFYKSTPDTGWNSSMLYDNKINYVYVDKNETAGFMPEYYPLIKVFENDTAEIYKVR